MSVASIRSGMAAALQTVADTSGLQVTAYQLSVPTPPTIEFFPETKTYHMAGGNGLDEWTWCVRAFVAANFDQAAQMTLDAMLDESGPSSVKAALEADSSLSGAVNDLIVVSHDGYQVFDGRNGLVLGSTWTLRLLVAG